MSESSELRLKLVRCFEEHEAVHKVDESGRCFKLSRGGLSPYYIDAKSVTLMPDCLKVITELVVHAIRRDGIKVDVVAGKALGAVPLCVAVSQALNVPALIIRDRPKDHGLGGRVVGRADVVRGKNVLVLDDVATTGSSILETIEEIEVLGGKVVKVIVVVDRLEGARRALEERGYKLESLLTRRDLGVDDEWLKRMTSVCRDQS